MLFSYLILRIYKKNEDIILDEKHFGDTIYNTSLDAVFIVESRSNVITDCNNRALELFEAFRKGSMINTSVASLFKDTSGKHALEIPAPFRKEGAVHKELNCSSERQYVHTGALYRMRGKFLQQTEVLDIE